MAVICFGTILIVLLNTVFSTNTDADNEATVIPLTTEQNAQNSTPYDLYVIRTYIYEVGILTNADNEMDNSTDTQERVDLTFFNPPHNSTFFNFANIPLPYQVNVSGQVVTKIVPTDLGTLQLNSSNFAVEKTTVSATKNDTLTPLEAEENILENLPVELLVK